MAGSARFSCDGIHLTTRACSAFIFCFNIVQYYCCSIADDRSVSPVPLTRVA
jgi:hypothetical protein